MMIQVKMMKINDCETMCIIIETCYLKQFTLTEINLYPMIFIWLLVFFNGLCIFKTLKKIGILRLVTQQCVEIPLRI